MSPADAKAWLIEEILAAAKRNGVELDSLERRMLEYSETERTPADLEELNAAFDQTHEDSDYEEKIAALIRLMLAQWRIEGSSLLLRWHEAVAVLSGEDHYLLVLISAAGQRGAGDASRPARRGLLKLFVIALVVTGFATIALGYLATHLH